LIFNSLNLLYFYQIYFDIDRYENFEYKYLLNYTKSGITCLREQFLVGWCCEEEVESEKVRLQEGATHQPRDLRRSFEYDEAYDSGCVFIHDK
jgi:hypothetical protein